MDIPGIVQSTTAYVGFTAATGGLGAVQDILDWTYTPAAAGLAPAAPTVTADSIAGTEGQSVSTASWPSSFPTPPSAETSLRRQHRLGRRHHVGRPSASNPTAHYDRQRHSHLRRRGELSGSVFVTDDRNGAALISATGTATIADAALTLSTLSGPLGTTSGTPLNASLLTFTDADFAGTADNYTATIDWGDGSVPDTLTSAAGGITASAGRFSVNGAHSFRGTAPSSSPLP